jgi:hypothetical protein
VPGFAQRTGKRIFFRPAFFQHGIGPIFSASERKYDIYFHYSWSEDDEVSIDLPSGFALDSAESPQPFGAGELSQYKVKISITKDGKTLYYKRHFFFGGKGQLFFPSTSYPQLKQFFDVLNQQDNHTITLKSTGS